MALGIFEWLTLGLHVSAIAFANTLSQARIKTNVEQQGPIKIACATVCEQRGLLWQVGSFFKGDHIVRNVSFIVGYSYAQQLKTVYSSCDQSFNSQIANSDKALHGWQMHTLHLMIEYDCIHSESYINPRICLSYNHVLGGTSIFNTPICSGQLGLDVCWYF